jgi:hypothetical protein
MLRHVAIVRSDILKKHIASIIEVTTIGELGITLAVSSILGYAAASVASYC